MRVRASQDDVLLNGQRAEYLSNPFLSGVILLSLAVAVQCWPWIQGGASCPTTMRAMETESLPYMMQSQCQHRLTSTLALRAMSEDYDIVLPMLS